MVEMFGEVVFAGHETARFPAQFLPTHPICVVMSPYQTVSDKDIKLIDAQS